MSLKGYDLSFLITHEHTTSFNPSKLIDFIVSFLQEIDKELNEMKIGVSSKARLAAETFLRPWA